MDGFVLAFGQKHFELVFYAFLTFPGVTVSKNVILILKYNFAFSFQC